MLKDIYKYALFLLLVLASCKDTEVIPQQSLTKEQEHLLLGNPSGATTEESNANNYLMLKTHYALSYSRDREHAQLGKLAHELALAGHSRQAG